jgi:hypothetical protein
VKSLKGYISYNPIKEVLELAERAYNPSVRATEDEHRLNTQFLRGHCVIEVSEKWNTAQDAPTDPIVMLPEPRFITDYGFASCKHECSLLRQTKMAK